MLFVPSGRSDTLYCDFIADGEEYSCRKIGANRQAKEKVANDPVLQEHRRAYQRLNKRKEYGYMEEAEFMISASQMIYASRMMERILYHACEASISYGIAVYHIALAIYH